MEDEKKNTDGQLEEKDFDGLEYPSFKSMFADTELTLSEEDIEKLKEIASK